MSRDWLASSVVVEVVETEAEAEVVAVALRSKTKLGNGRPTVGPRGADR